MGARRKTKARAATQRKWTPAKNGPVSTGGDRRISRAGWITLALVAIILLLTIDDRHVGSVADGRQMIWTAIAMTETGQLGQARGHDFSLPRDDVGDGVSRYGMGMSFAQIPAAVLAPVVEKRLGAGSSQPLFLLAPLLAVLLGGLAAARIAVRLGADHRGQILAVLLATIASPIGSYAAMAFTEPLQGAVLAWTLLMAIACAQAPTAKEAKRMAAMAGFAGGCAVLVKSANLVVAPFLLLPILAVNSRATAGRRVWFAMGGSFVSLAIWLLLEMRRFGAPLGGYPGEGFTHPLLDGLWRLLVSPTEGFLLFFPASIAALWLMVKIVRNGSQWERMTTAAVIAATTILFAMAAAYWGWHGNEGWGPRLVLPAVPLLAPFAALAIQRWSRSLAVTFVIASILLNLPPLVQHPTPVATYITNLRWPVVDETRARGIPPYARIDEADGTVHISPDNVLAEIPSASGWIVYPWFFRLTCSDDAQAARMMERPPWHNARPDLVPRIEPVPPVLARYITREPRWSFWGRGFAPTGADVAYRAVYDEGLSDQVIRLQTLGNVDAALTLARKLHEIAPSGDSVTLVLESLRLAGRREEAKRFLSAQPVERRTNPKINVVLALFERDEGNEEAARLLLSNAAERLSVPPLQQALKQPMERWPRDLDSMTRVPVYQVGSRIE